MMTADAVVIGGGAAGYFGAIACAEQNPQARVVLLEKTGKVLAKVLVSGGGRCNVTHDCRHVSQLLKHYPRGSKFLRKPFEQFGVPATIDWFESRGVRLKTEADGRMFPVTDSSASIANCLQAAAAKAGVDVQRQTAAEALTVQPPAADHAFSIRLSNGQELRCRKVLVATGGNPHATAYDWLRTLGHQVELPVPSLFTFNTPGSSFQALQGISVPKARVRLVGHKLEEEGPLLVTHWGFSGPAVLRLSAWGARLLHQLQYHFSIQISWVPDLSEEELRTHLAQYQQAHPKRAVAANPLFGLPQRLWSQLVAEAGISPELRWLDLPKKSFNRLVEWLFRSPFDVKGKTTFKEEFVTAGGISLDSVSAASLESKAVPGLYFAGELLDIDGITGGFNFQAAWATGYAAGRHMAAALRELPE